MTATTIEALDPHAVADADWEAICRLLNPYRHEIDTRLVLLDVAEAKRRFQTQESFYRDEYFWVRSPESEVIAWLEVGRFVEGDENRHLQSFAIVVAAPWRRQGLGTALLAHAVAMAEAEGQTLLTSAGNSRLPAGEAFLTRIGGDVALRHVTNELPLADLDHTLLDAWIKRAAERAAAYELVPIPSPYPAELLEPIAVLFRLMAGAPLEDLDADHMQWTAEQVADTDRVRRARGGQCCMLAARHRPSGQFVGYTFINYFPFQPMFLWQDDTAVAPDHRNRGLGRWLKAANLQRAMAAYPAAQYVRTGNAGSNAAMLSINHALGFREIFASTVIQVPLAAAQAYLRQRAAG